MGKIDIFGGSDGDSDVGIKTNQAYAKTYNTFKKKEVSRYLKTLDSEDSSEDDVTTDEDVIDTEIDKEFFKSLAFLKSKDPNKYKEIPTFFEKTKTVEEAIQERKEKKVKAMSIKEYGTNVILENGGVFEEEEDKQHTESPSLVKEQEMIKDEIKKALSKIGGDSNDESDEETTGGLLKKRDKTKKEVEKDREDYVKWLADQNADDNITEEVKPLKPLKDFWNNKNLSKEDAFLRDYILNKRFVENYDIPTYDEIVNTSEDEQELEKQAEYEHKYNFRYEEPDKEFIKRYPRVIEDSVRAVSTKRKDKRKELKERKQHEKDMKKRELEELKAIKLQEIQEKIKRLKEIAGKDNLNINEDELEADFEPNEHDRKMSTVFDDAYYNIDADEEKPEFPDLDEELQIENWENFDKDKETAQHCEDDNFNMDCDFDENAAAPLKNTFQEELLENTRKKRNGRRISKLAEIIRKDKPLFDPEDEKTYAEYIDEYYKLEYEDIIGDMPCRFKYVETVPNDFGLTVEEIMMAPTKELNRWASAKKTVQIRPKYLELNDVQLYKSRAHREDLKRKFMPSLFKTHEDESEDENIRENKITKFNGEDQGPDEPKKKKKKKSKRASEPIETADDATKDLIAETDTVTKKKKKKNRVGESEEVVEPQNEEEVVTKKKKKNKVVESEEAVEPQNGEEVVTKKKKKNKVVEAEEVEAQNEEEVVTKKKKKTKDVQPEEVEAQNEEEVVTKKKKKTKDVHPEEIVEPQNGEEVTKKKKKSKVVEAEEVEPQNGEEVATKKKKKNKVVEAEEVEPQNGEEVVDKKKKKKKNKEEAVSMETEAIHSKKKNKRKLDTPADEESRFESKKQHKPNKQFHKNKSYNHGNDYDNKTNVTDSRLRAFGLNPTRFHNQQKYGKKAE